MLIIKILSQKMIRLNTQYLTKRYNHLLENNFLFLNFEDNGHYLNFTESEYEFIIENNKSKNFNWIILQKLYIMKQLKIMVMTYQNLN